MLRRTAALALLFTLSACDEDPSPEPFRELYDRGLDRYVGTPEVVPDRVWDEPAPVDSAYIANYAYGALDPAVRGPLCMRGAEYVVQAKDGPSDELLIFLQGGGLCVEEVCIATETPLGLGSIEVLTTQGAGGVLNRSDPDNPLAEADLVYLPYCDGSIFVGDVDRQLGGSMAYQRGLLNLTAALEVAHERYPRPSRVVIVGTSGGAYGSLPAVALARHFYPRVEIVALSDSGAPIGKDQDTTFMHRAMQELDADLLPESCPDCVVDGHLTGLVSWALDHDPHMRLGYMGHLQDSTIGTTFLGITGPEFEVGLRREIGELIAAYPHRTNAFLVPGVEHTFVLDLAVVGAAADAIAPGAMLGGMDESGTDDTGATVSGWQWFERFLAGPDGSNVIP